MNNSPSTKRLFAESIDAKSSETEAAQRPKKKKPTFRVHQLQTTPCSRHTNDEVHLSIEMCPIVSAFLDTPPLQRLRLLKQLSTAEYVYINTNHNRFEHSLGVSSLAERMVRSIHKRQPGLGCTEKDILCVKLAGLMHDIGHGPYSHTYELFVKTVLPSYRESHPESEAFYRNQPELPVGWKHEHTSMMMLDTILDYLGLAIDLRKLDAPLQQIGDGLDATTLGPYVYDGDDNEDSSVDAATHMKVENVLTSRDFVFIKECIWGGPIPEVEEKLGITDFIGRGQDKEWLYDVVSNRHSGLDVDKIDYYARDERRAMGKTGNIKNIFIEEARVAWAKCIAPAVCVRCRTHARAGANGGAGLDVVDMNRKEGKHLMICYPDKMVKSTMDFFKKRFFLHATIYHHKVVSAASFMVCDILRLADPHFLLPTYVEDRPHGFAAKAKLGVDRLPISRAMLDQASFLRLNDSILDLIAGTTDPNLKEARLLICRLKSKRSFYTFAAEQILDMREDKHERIWKLSAKDIKHDMIMLGGKHKDNYTGDVQTLIEDDLIIEHCSIHHGQKDQNPLSHMRFIAKADRHCLSYSISKLPEAKIVDETTYRTQLPMELRQNSIRVFCKDEAKTDLAQHVFRLWWFELIHETDITPCGDSLGQEEGQEEAIMLTQESWDDESRSDQDGDYMLQSPKPTTSGRPQITPNGDGVARMP